MKTEIYIATHKVYNFPKVEGYIPIHVGKALTSVNLGIQGDDTGENISELNKNFCELTALYWMWKNSDADIVGLVHYRRYFIVKGAKNYLNYRILDKKYLNDLDFNSNTILLSKPVLMRYKFRFISIKDQYLRDHLAQDWCALERVIADISPEYLTSFRVVGDQKKISYCNMMIVSKKVLNDYCTWLFRILFELMNRVDISNYDTYQSRIYGFLSERLLNVYIHYNSRILDVRYIHTTNIEDRGVVNRFKNMIFS